jgi:predicted dehydrogenase
MTDSTLKIGLIGTGFGKSTQMPGFEARDDVKVVAVCSRRLAKARALADEFHIPAAYDDYRAMLAREGLDIVSIVTPTYLHQEMTLAALAAGVHVLCEKPMAMNVAEAHAMCDAARSARRIGMIDHEFRYIAGRAAMKQLIDEGYIGKPYHLSIHAFTAMRADPQRAFNWWSEAEKGGGLLGAIGSHFTDAIRVFLGEIESVCGFVDTRITRRPDGDGVLRSVTSDDNCAFLARVKGGATASVHLSSVTRPGMGERIQLAGSEGSLMLDGSGKLWGGHGADAHLLELEIPEALKPEGAGLIGPFKLLLARLVDGVRRMDAGEALDGAAAISPSFEDGLKVQRVLDGVRASSAGSGWIQVS